MKKETKKTTKKEVKAEETVKRTKKNVIQRDENTVKEIQIRLNRISGLVGGIKNMIDDGRSSDEILVQLSAIASILQNVKFDFIKEVMKNEIVSKFKADNPKGYDDFVALIKRYL